MIKLLLIYLLTIPIIGFGHTPYQDSIFIQNNVRTVQYRIKKVTEYHSNGELSVIGKTKMYVEPLGCLGPWPVYKKTGRWKFYGSEGKLIKVVIYKKDKQKKVILK
jgi:antitoxin component YwqK of YwqJK toxin-antitoxin module